MSLLMTIKGLPMTYNRDLQEDKEPLFDSIDQIKLALEVMGEMMAVAKVCEDRTLEATSDPFLLATDLADYLVLKKIPFRDAHEIMGKLTAYSLNEGRGFGALSLEEYQQFSNVFENDVFKVLDIKTALRSRKAVGAPSPLNVGRQITKWQKRLHAASSL